MEKGLAKLLGHPCQTICAGRTDAGVHALTQLVQFKTLSLFPLEKLKTALQSLLPLEIAVVECFELPLEFHARYSALARHYCYVILNQKIPNPFLTSYVWHYARMFDISLFKSLWETLPGTKDGSAFCKSGSYRKNLTVKIQSAHCRISQSFLFCHIIAESFLYNMVRTLVGTILDISKGRFPKEHLDSLFSEPHRQNVGYTAPPNGLYLYNVLYPEKYHIQLTPYLVLPLIPFEA